MEELTSDKDSFIQALLAERDRLFQENSRLRSKLEDHTDVELLKSSYEETISHQKQKIISLEHQVAYLQRRIWGKSSERFIKEDPQQRRLDFEGLELLPEEKEEARLAEEEIIRYKTRTVAPKEKSKPVRKPIPENIPRVEEHIYPKNIDPEEWIELAPEITEVLEYKPEEFFVRRIIRHKYVLRDKSTQAESNIVTAVLPPLPLAKSYAGASLLAELMVNKYVNHLPFYRQIQMFKQLGISLPAATISDWFSQTADLLRPLYYRLKELVLSSDYIQVDESTIPIINEEKHKTVKGYIWMVRAVMGNLVFFYYDHGSRAQKVVIPLLRNFQGTLQTDGYEVYKIYEDKKGVLPLGCWAHARRKFEEALKEDNLENVLAYQYDFVCNGYEMASGAVRNHDIKIMKRAFELAGYTEEDVETKFRSLYTAFQYGAPPHAGMAPGIDRILMLLKDEENIREMVAFPLGANGADAMMGCPGEVFEKQLRETHINVRD